MSHNQCRIKAFKFNARIFCGAAPVYFHTSLVSVILPSHEYITDAAAFILVIVALWFAGACRQWHPGFTDQLTRRLIHRDHRHRCGVQSPVYIEYIFHRGNKMCVGMRCYHPTESFPWLNFVFLTSVEWSHTKQCQCIGVLRHDLPAAVTTIERSPAVVCCN